MYNADLLKNNYQLEISVSQGEIWYINGAPKKLIEKNRPVLIISDQESFPGGLVFCLQITTKYHHANSVPFLMNGQVSFINTCCEYVMSIKDLYTYGTRIGIIPNRVLEITRYRKVRIYGMPLSEEHEKAYFDYSINILRRLLSEDLRLTRLHDNELNPKEFLGGKFSKTFSNWKPKKNNSLINIKEEPIRGGDSENSSNRETIASLGVEEIDSSLVYSDRSGETSFNTMGAALMNALESGSGKLSVDKKKEINARKPKHNRSRNTHQRKNHDSSVVKEILEKEEIQKVTDKKPYIMINDKGKRTIKKVKDMTCGEMSLLLLDVYKTNSYSIFTSKLDVGYSVVKNRCMECIKKLDEAGLEIPEEERTYFLTDQRIKNNYTQIGGQLTSTASTTYCS